MSASPVATLSIKAMSLNIPTGGHPNKMPFNGVLVHLDRPSDAAPSGAHGKRIIVTANAGRKALSSLLGMAVNFTPSFDGHDGRAKIGVISSAAIVGSAIVVSGHIYAADFPDEARTIKTMKDALGFSFEAQRLTVLDPSAAILVVTELSFTGAAILLKDKAAYQTTSIAASAEASGHAPPFRRMPNITRENVVPVLRSLGLHISSITAAMARPVPVGAVDAALNAHNVPLTDKIRFKRALERLNLLAS